MRTPLTPPCTSEMCNEDVNQQERDKLQFDSGQTFAESGGEAICGGERQWTLLGREHGSISFATQHVSIIDKVEWGWGVPSRT